MTSTEGGASTRLGFVTAVAQDFKDAGIRHVFLHHVADEPSGDSDIDIAVARESLVAVDTIVRAGRLGRLLQRFDYDVPWCRFYVIETDEPGRHLRQLDIACDPFGIGRYGDAVQLALEHAQRGGRPEHAPARRDRRLPRRQAGSQGPPGTRRTSVSSSTNSMPDPDRAATLLQAAFDEPWNGIGTSARRWLRPSSGTAATSAA